MDGGSRVDVTARGDGMRRARAPWLVALVALIVATGCDLVQGLGAAGNAIFPEDPTHVEAPGSLLAAGNFSNLDFAGIWLGPGAIGFKLLARTARSGDDSLSVIGFTDGRVCRVENVGAYVASTIAAPGEVMLAYLDGPGPRGTLRFVDSDCVVLPAVVPDATLSSATLADGRRILLAGEALVLVDAASGVIEPLELPVERVATRSGGPYLVQADGKLAVYDDDWQLVSRYGEGVVSFGYLASTIVFEDAHGIWSVPPTGGQANSIAPTACDLGFSSLQPVYLIYRLPCEGGRTVAQAMGSVEMLELGPDIDPRHAEFWKEARPIDPPLRVAHFRDFDEDTRTGTLLLRVDGSDLTLGEHAAPEWIRPSQSGNEGFALLNVDGDVGDFVQFDITGNVRVFAERAVRENDGIGMLVHFDGAVGDMGIVTGDGAFTVLLPRVPRENYNYYSNPDLRNAAVFNEFDGHTGTLSLFATTYDDLETVATRVIHPHHGFIESLFPGVAWIRSDGSADTGTLEYRNTRLVYTATVSEGVESFLPTTEGLIYAVPRGKGAGVWFADAK
jgi:hypothetical protein